MEEPKSQDWALQEEEEESKKEKPSAVKRFFLEEEERVFRNKVKGALFEESKRRGEEWSETTARQFVKSLKLWEDFKPRRVQALCACKGGDETELSFEPGAVMTAVRPAAWMQARWLEGTLDGRVGRIYGEDVEYL